MRSAASIAAGLLALAPLGILASSSAQQPLSGTDGSFSIASSGNPSSEAPKYRDELLRLHRELVSIESISGNEAPVGRFLSDHLEAKGYTVQRQRVPPREGTPEGAERFNLLAWHGKRDARPRVVVTSHIDTVPPYIPYSLEGDEGGISGDTIIKGRGTNDAKGSVAAMVVAVDELRAAGAAVKDDVMLVFVVGEEVAGDGMAAFSESLARSDPPRRFDAAIFGEPTGNRLACGHKGALFCDLRAHGKPGHSGYPWLGKSANEIMIRALARVLDADLGNDKLFGKTTFNVGRFEGGVAANVIPEHAVVKFGARVASGSEKHGATEVQRKIQAILDDVDTEALSMDCKQGYGPVKCKCDVPDFETVVVNYGTDVPNMHGDHARYLYGPGSILVAHGARENVTVGDLETAVEGYKKLILHALKHDKSVL